MRCHTLVALAIFVSPFGPLAAEPADDPVDGRGRFPDGLPAFVAEPVWTPTPRTKSTAAALPSDGAQSISMSQLGFGHSTPSALDRISEAAAEPNPSEPTGFLNPEPIPRVWNGAISSENESPPDHIRDNGFLVEEASNQGPDEVQHIFNWVQFWDRTGGGRTRDFSHSYTMELPLGSQTHQFSFTTQFLDGFEKPDSGAAGHQGGVGDTFLNYRYQLLADDDFLWAAPRFSLIVPTGDERFGLGTGELGYQFNLPISHYGERFDFHFNSGYTITPNVTARLPSGAIGVDHDLNGYNLGGSVLWKPRVDLNFFVEALALWNDEIDDLGNRQNVTQVFVNPGLRFAVCQFDEVEWVLGVAVPVGLTCDTPDIGVFAYMSVEHAFLKLKPSGKAN